MKKGELIALNAAFGKLTLPDMRMEDRSVFSDRV